jgi:hypothetical protein
VRTCANRSTDAQVDHHCRAVRALAEQGEDGGDGLGRRDDDRRLDDRVLGLDVGDDVGDHLGRHVLRHDRDRAPAGDGLGHPAARDGRHVGDDHGDRRAGAVVGREVDVEAARHVGARRDHEDVAVGEVGGGLLPVEEAHRCPL